jgi:hypothetical protein
LNRVVDSLDLYQHQELEIRAHDKYDTIVHIGGVGSGKTITLVCWLLDRSSWDTGQEHALFTYTATQREQVLQRVYPWLERCGVDHVWNRRPPDAWVERWKRDGIPQPPHRDRYTNTITLSTGLRIQTGTLFNQTYEQFKGPEWGSIAIEEFTAGPDQRAIEWVMDRARCGEGLEYCTTHHRHTKILHGNPPEDDGHWSFDWLKKLDGNAAKLQGGVTPEGEDTYPNLLAGIGSILYIQSSSEENEHTGAYAQNLRERLDDETARRRLGGEMRRSRIGLVYSAFARANEHDVPYHRDRTLYVNLDFNNRPIAAGLCHPLNPGEYPSEHQRPGVNHVGKFGEVFDTQGGGLQALCALLLGGGLGNKGAAPREWQGLLEHKGPVIFFGDGTGLNKSASGMSLWAIVDDVVGKALRARGIKYSRDVGLNVLVPIRARSVNAKFCSASGVRSFWVDPRCKQSIADYTAVVWDKAKPDVQKYGERGGGDRWLLTHLSDADGYMIVTLFPLGSEPLNLPPTKADPTKRRFEIPEF